ncbi:MAG: hypothetical protein JWO78_226 [Micavibrio sp.]|nr:hypothetical protein [Micavibrio sp.]
MTEVSSLAQCLIENEGHWFLCPAGKSREAHVYFEAINELPPDSDKLPALLPEFLIQIEDPEKLIFFGARTGF